jgi:hypothetical protein
LFEARFDHICPKIMMGDITDKDIKSFLAEREQALIEGIVEMIEDMKTEERKTKDFGDYTAESYYEKMFANAVLSEVQLSLTNKTK